MRLGDITASASLPTVPGVPPGPSAAIQSGQALFQSAMNGSTNVVGMMGAAAGIVSGLPAGPFTSAIQQCVDEGTSIASAVAAGTAVGGPYGAAAAACIAIVTTVVGALQGTSMPQADVRSTAEQWCFPGIDPGNPPPFEGGSAYNSFAGQVPALLLPFCQPNTRLHTVGFLPLSNAAGADPTDGTTNQIGNFAFGIGWVPAPGSTEESTAAAMDLANGWLAAHSQEVTNQAPTSSQMDWTNTLGASIEEDLGETSGNSVFDEVRYWLSSWWGDSGWAMEFGLQAGGPPLAPDVNPQNPYGYFWTPGSWAQASNGFQRWGSEWATAMGQLNSQTSLDYVYFFSYTVCGIQTAWNVSTSEPVSPVGPAAIAEYAHLGSSGLSSSQVLWPCACPDTSLVGLAEIAYLVVKGQIPSDQADLVALHYMLGLQYQWVIGTTKDQRDPSTAIGAFSAPNGPNNGLPWAPPHPNFSRVIGVISAKIAKNRGQTAPDGAPLPSASTSFAAVLAAAAKKKGVTTYGAVETYGESFAAMTARSKAKIAAMTQAEAGSPLLAAGLGVAALLAYLFMR
jgi:hypothetical protein